MTDTSETDALFEQLYRELHRVADGYVARGRAVTLQATALVNEAWVRMSGAESTWNDREHFLAIAARAMRQVLVDHARRRRAAKRGGAGDKLTLCDDVIGAAGAPLDVLDLDAALQGLAARFPRHAELVQLRFFGGMSIADAAHWLDVSEATAKTDWRFARAWLNRQLSA